MNFRKVIFAIAGVLVGVNTHAQITPGGIGTTNLTAWFRADDIALGSATDWTSYYPSGPSAITVNDPQAPYPMLTNTPTGAVSNYNKTLSFQGNTYLGMNLSTVQGFRNSSVPDLLSNAYSGNEGTFFGAYYMPQPPSGNGHMLLYNDLSDGIQMRNLNTKGRLGIGLLTSDDLRASRDWIEDFRPNVTSYRGNRSSYTSFEAYNKASDISSAVASQSSGSNGLYMGYSPTIQTSAYNGFLHEFIFFNRDLTDEEMSKVHSYIAIKYGITLDNSLGGTYGDYIATDGTLIWDADLNSDYHNDVIGIGRDDVEGLTQKQSHAFDDSIRIYIGSLAATNDDNAGSFASDLSYVTLGHNGGMLCGTTAGNMESPISVTSRIEREFKITNSNFGGAFSLDITIDTCSSIEGVDVSNIRLLVDNDGDFSDAIALDQTSGITFSILNGIVTVSGISNSILGMNSTKYFTIGYIDSDYTITTGPAICSGESSWVVFNTAAPTPLNINYSDGVNVYSADNVTDGDTLYLAPNTSTTYSFYSTSALINCCNDASIQQFELVVNPLPIIDITIEEDTICLGGSTTLTANGSDTYSWNNNVQNAVSFEPIITDTYFLTATTALGCIDSSEVEVVVNSLPNVEIQNPINELCFGDSIAYIGTGALEFSWNNGINNEEYFSPTIGTLTYVVEGIDGNGCINKDSVELTVHPSPSIQVFSDNSVCRGNDVNIDVDADMTGDFTWYGTGAVYLNQLMGSDVIFNSPNDGNYDITVRFENEFSCSVDSTFSIAVDVCEPPTANIDASTNFICPGDVIQFNDASVGDSITSWEWQFPGGDVTSGSGVGPFDISFAVAGTYEVVLEVTNFEGTSTDTYSIVVLPCLPPDVSFEVSESVICETHCTEIANTSVEGDTYAWYVNGEYQFTENTNTSAEFCFDLSETYDITIIGTNIYGIDTLTQSILVNPMPDLTYNTNVEVVYGDSSLITIPELVGESIYWQSDVACPTCFQNEVLVLETTSFDYIITNEFNCQDSNYFTVYIEYEDYVDVPDNFSPNNDNVNDMLYVKGLGIEELTFKVFNRYGQLVFKSNDQEEGWDGTVMGFPADESTFVYTVSYKLVNGTIGHKNGYVNLIR